MTDLKGRNILVTGAGQGIGKALCLNLASLDANVIAVSRSPEHLNELKTESPTIHIIQADLEDWSGTKAALADVPPLHGLVNNAGVAVIKPFAELTEQDIDKTINVNLKAIFCVTQAVNDKLEMNASVVNVSSVASSKSFLGHSVYSATKAGVDSLTKTLALELGHRKIRFNTINPTVVLTAMGIANWSDPRKAGPLLNRIPLLRFAELNDVVSSIVFLLSDQSSFVNGHHLLLDGGLSSS